MDDPIIRMSGIEVYGKLKSYKFLPSRREYFNVECILIDNLTNKSATMENLQITVGLEVPPSLKNNCMHVKQVSKTSNRKEKHEVDGHEAQMRLGDCVYMMDRVFVRTELIKTVPPREVIYHKEEEDTAEPNTVRRRVEQLTRS